MIKFKISLHVHGMNPCKDKVVGGWYTIRQSAGVGIFISIQE